MHHCALLCITVHYCALLCNGVLGLLCKQKLCVSLWIDWQADPGGVDAVVCLCVCACVAAAGVGVGARLCTHLHRGVCCAVCICMYLWDDTPHKY